MPPRQTGSACQWPSPALLTASWTSTTWFSSSVRPKPAARGGGKMPAWKNISSTPYSAPSSSQQLPTKKCHPTALRGFGPKSRGNSKLALVGTMS